MRQINAPSVHCVPALLLLLVLLLPSASRSQTVQQYRNVTVNNLVGEPVNLIDVKGTDRVVAQLVIFGKSMTFGDNQRPTNGAGGIAGDGERDFFSVLLFPSNRPLAQSQTKGQVRQITVTKKGGYLICCGGIPLGSGELPDLANGPIPQGALLFKMAAIVWNDDGSTAAVAKLQPYIGCSNGKRVKIISPVEKPTIKDGVFFVDTQAGRLSLKIKYGFYGTAEGPIDAMCAVEKKSDNKR